jgi:DNA-binding IscR family transcriptional regulator
MFKEMKSLEYVVEILRIFHENPGKHDSKRVNELIEAGQRIQSSLTYVQKILPRMARIGLLTSSSTGYGTVMELKDVSLAQILNICDMPPPDALLYSFCEKLKEAFANSPATDFYNF